MKTFKKECLEETDASIIKFEEKKKVITFLNSQHQSFVKVKVDGCQITNGMRCDDLLVNKHTNDEHFVELKGVDVGHAMEQLAQSMNDLSDRDCKNKEVHAYIVSSNYAPKLNSKRQAFIKKSKDMYGKSFTLTIKERRLEVKL